MPNTQPRRAHENPQRNIEHIRNNVIEPKHHKRKRRPPDPNDLAEELAAHERQVSGQADQPVGADAAQKYLVPGGCDCFCGCESDYAGVLGCRAEGTAVAGDDGHYEEGAGEVAPEGDEPVEEHFPG